MPRTNFHVVCPINSRELIATSDANHQALHRALLWLVFSFLGLSWSCRRSRSRMGLVFHQAWGGRATTAMPMPQVSRTNYWIFVEWQSSKRAWLSDWLLVNIFCYFLGPGRGNASYIESIATFIATVPVNTGNNINATLKSLGYVLIVVTTKLS